LRLRLNKPVDGDSLIFCGIDFQTMGAENLKALRPTALVVRGTRRRLSEEDQRSRPSVAFTLMYALTVFYWTCVLSLPLDHSPQSTCLVMSCEHSIFLPLYLKPAVCISCFQILLGRRLPLWPCSIDCSVCLHSSSVVTSQDVSKTILFSSSWLVLVIFFCSSLLAVLSCKYVCLYVYSFSPNRFHMEQWLSFFSSLLESLCFVWPQSDSMFLTFSDSVRFFVDVSEVRFLQETPHTATTGVISRHQLCSERCKSAFQGNIFLDEVHTSARM